jgi:sarcosine oxidase
MGVEETAAVGTSNAGFGGKERMKREYDVIVAGLGAMGSAATYHLAASGRRVLGLDRFRPPHDFGSSHGRTRIIREAYFEHTLYVPLVRRAYELWAELERRSGRQLLLQTGGLMIGPPGGVLVSGARRSAEEHGLRHEILSAAEVRKRFPACRPSDDMVAVWEPRAGILFPELAIQTHLELAARNKAELRFDEAVLRWEREGSLLRVITATNSYYARRLVLSAGAWMNSLLPDLKLPLWIERQVLCWFEPAFQPEMFQPEKCPIFILEHAPSRFFYGFPDLGDGVKAAIHHEGERTQADELRREVDEQEDTEVLKGLLRQFVPGAAGRLLSATVCMYTNTPDAHFILGHHPMVPEIVIASPCSGHGFKFSPVIGALVATLLSDRLPPFDLSLFKPERFAAAVSASSAPA